MNNAALHSAGILNIELFVGRFRLQRFVFSAASIDFDVSAFTWQLLVKTNPGDRLNVISLTLGNGLAFPIYEDNVIEARFESVTTAIGEGDYYWQLVRTDTNEPWLNGKAKFSFGPLGSQGTAQEATINLVNQEISVELSSIVNVGGSGGGTWGTITGTLTDQTDLDAAFKLKLDALFTQYEKTDSYTLLAADKTAVEAGQSVLFVLNAGVSKNFTIPPNATVAMPLNLSIPLLRTNTGQWTFVAGVGVTINASAGVLTDAGQNQFMFLTQITTNVWHLANGGTSAGDVVGPSSAVDSSIVLFDGTTGKLIKDSGRIITLIPVFYKSNVPASPGSHTGSTTETVLDSVLIPANTFQANDHIVIRVVMLKTGTVGSCNTRIRVNTQAAGPVVAGATQMAIESGAATTLTRIMTRQMVFKNSQSSQDIFPAAVSALTDETSSTTTISALTTDYSAAQYIFVTGNLGNSGDTITLRSWYIQIIR